MSSQVDRKTIKSSSILGPLLFTIYFNDVHMPLQSSSIITYADDTVIFTADLDIIQRRLNEDLDNMSY